jgi:hypothetical protein
MVHMHCLVALIYEGNNIQLIEYAARTSAHGVCVIIIIRKKDWLFLYRSNIEFSWNMTLGRV